MSITTTHGRASTTYVRIGVGDDRPVEPREPGAGDLARPVLDVRVAGRGRQLAAVGAVVVRRVEVARAPVVADW